MKIRDERERTKKYKDRKTQRNGTSYSENVRAKWFCYTLKLGFVQLMRKASLIFKLNLELSLSITLRERELYKSKHVMVEFRCLKYATYYPF